MEIDQTQQMLQEAQKAHNKAIAETYKQLRNQLSGDAQSQSLPRDARAWLNGLQ